jgi:hypothetical protein
MEVLLGAILKLFQPWLSNWLRQLAEKVPLQWIEKNRNLLVFISLLAQYKQFEVLYFDLSHITAIILFRIVKFAIIEFIRALLSRRP